MATVESTARATAGSSRPAARPSTQASRHHLEPNPFEQSFSSKPSSNGGRSASPESRRGEGGSRKHASKATHKSTKSDSGVEENASSARDDASSQTDDSKKSSGGPSTPGSTLSKRILPPAASIASPSVSQDNTSITYPWGSSLTSSLRAGPLSPAMLAGPQNFDPTTFRTGLTPDLSSFKTGLTPLGTAGGSFPPPSPNTAAFLAMVTNGSGSGLSGAAITPNTLSALTNNPIDVHANGGHALQQANAMQGEDDAEKGASSIRHTQQQQFVHDDRRANEDSSNDGQHSKGAENPAASGLFLLTQAHHELAKRGDGPNEAQSQMYGNGSMANAKSLYSNVPAQKNHAGKSKGLPASAKPHQSSQSDMALLDDASQHQNKNGKRKSGGGLSDTKLYTNAKKSKNVKNEFQQSPSGGESDELVEEFGARAGSSFDDGGEFGGDDDEKRKNFLERNRQAALKCRQRKKAWLASLQAKVEYLQSDNEHLQGTVGALRNEVMFLKSQLMQAQRQLATNGAGSDPMQRHSVSGPMGMPTNMMPTAVTHVPHSSIHAMAAAAAAATSGANSMMSVAYAPSQPTPQQQALPLQQQQTHIPRPTHMPAMHAGPHYGAQSGGKQHARQSSVHAV